MAMHAAEAMFTVPMLGGDKKGMISWGGGGLFCGTLWQELIIVSTIKKLDIFLYRNSLKSRN